MLQARGQPSLPLEAIDLTFRERQVRMQDLDRDPAVEAGVESFPDGARAPLADAALKLVGAQA